MRRNNVDKKITNYHKAKDIPSIQDSSPILFVCREAPENYKYNR
jgi:hypothetical protein